MDSRDRTELECLKTNWEVKAQNMWVGICQNVIRAVVITYCKGSIANIKEPISSPTKTATGIAVYTIRDETLITSVIVYNLGPGESQTSQATKLI